MGPVFLGEGCSCVLGEARDGSEQVGKVVGDATGERAECFHFLCLAEFGFQALAFAVGEVALAEVAEHGRVDRLAGTHGGS